ncbi:vacuolar protein sorting-associated protein 62 [Penicillium brasilianum]|uniref:Vacuolar protein sorting-associated protein 62 n=1 Tax=Penicillium brasilianum TaxID=104259 RepID=A0A1S9RID0_PENBI|nr:vacuolar protein sorting-associated protein 62 [Penicillium brasilianum]
MRHLILYMATLAPLTTSLVQSTATIPSYVYEYAPLVWLHSQDAYRPGDMQAQLDHTTPEVNWTAIQGAPSPLTLNNLDQLNNLGNTSVYLTSHEGIAASPEPAWFRGITPDAEGRIGNGTGCAIIVVDHGKGNVDAFYFYFYPYNKGDIVLGMEFGDHIGDWEHNMIRFANGTPQAIWFSQHASGQAFTYNALEKKGKRPYSYSGNGTHANYAVKGQHDHTIPGLNLPTGFLLDYTDRGPLWDPTLNAYAYTYDPTTGIFTPSSADTPVAWLDFNGRWGDDQPPGEPTIFGEAKYVAGPDGPKFKTLDRKYVCPSTPCVVLPFRIFAE